MDFINTIEIAGRIGSLNVQDICGTKKATMSIRVDHVFTGRNGGLFCKTDWIPVSVWQRPGLPDLATLAKEKGIRVKGRLTSTQYTRPDGTDASYLEVVAEEMSLPED